MQNYRPLGRTPSNPKLGRLVSDDDNHIRSFPYSAIQPETVQTVEKILVLPSWHWTHDQGQEGSCVGHGGSMERAITNTAQNKLLAKLSPFTRRYDPLWLWNRAKEIDPWPETNPGDDNGTSVRSAYDVLRAQGPRRIKTTGIQIIQSRPVVSDFSHDPDPADGVAANRWATTVDQIRTAISKGNPVTIGVNWYGGADTPARFTDDKHGTAYWILRDTWGRLEGGHSLVIYGASDVRQAFRLKNSWGRQYPLVWIPYSAMERLLAEDGEATLQSDR